MEKFFWRKLFPPIGRKKKTPPRKAIYLKNIDNGITWTTVIKRSDKEKKRKEEKKKVFPLFQVCGEPVQIPPRAADL